MNPLSSYLERLRSILKDKTFEKKQIQEVIERFSGIVVDINNISIQNKTLYIKENNYIKNDLFLKKKILIENLKEKGFFIEDLR